MGVLVGRWWGGRRGFGREGVREAIESRWSGVGEGREYGTGAVSGREGGWERGGEEGGGNLS